MTKETATPRCYLSTCDSAQHFPEGPSEECLDHSLENYFHWRLLAEFGPIVEVWA